MHVNMAYHTEYYTDEELNRKHLVKYQPLRDDGYDYHYYDFELSRWRPVQAVFQLPYDLQTLKFLDDPGDSERRVVTCKDSYRLARDGKDMLSHESLREEYLWREEMAKCGRDFEMEYISSVDKNGKITGYQSKVLCVKDDIVPGVIIGGKREYPGINGFGYIYKESKKFSKSGTHFDVVSEEQKIQEKIQDEKRQEEYRIKDSEKKKIRDGFPYRTWSKYSDYDNYYNTTRFYDTREYFKTYQDIKSGTKDDLIRMGVKPGAREFTPFEILICTLMKHECDWVHTRVDDVIGDVVRENFRLQENSTPVGCKKYTALNQYDLVFDIRVFNATFCVLWCGDGYPLEKTYGLTMEDQGYRRGFEMTEVRDEKNGIAYHTLQDVTSTNPLLRAAMGSTFRLYTDGDRVQYSAGMMHCKMSDDLIIDGNAHTINQIQDHIVLNGHLWAFSYAFPASELIDVPDEVRKKDEIPKKNEWEVTVYT